MRKIQIVSAIISLLLFIFYACKKDQIIGPEGLIFGPDSGLVFAKTFGGANWDVAYSVKQTTDGGYIVAGRTDSYGAGGGNFWLIKTDSSGNLTWSNTFGGGGIDIAYSVKQTTDRGYIIAGGTNSYGTGNMDFWLIKTDDSGNLTWSKTFGGSLDDEAKSVQQTTDGGYIITGFTKSYGAGGYDFWLIKTDGSGNLTWSNTFGGSLNDSASSVQQTTDGGYIIAGETIPYPGGSYDFWLIKTDDSGNLTWSNTFGGVNNDRASSVQQTTDGGYIITGSTYSYGTGSDFWLIKTDGSGNLTWSNTFGGSASDNAYSVQQITDGGYIITGSTYSYGTGNEDFYLIKTDSSGNLTWSKTFGGGGNDIAYSVQQTTDGEYIIAGRTSSYGAGSSDVWLIKIDGSVNIQ